MPHRLLTAVGLTIVLAAGQGCSDATPFAPARGLAGATSTSDASTQAAGLAADVTGTWRYNEDYETGIARIACRVARPGVRRRCLAHELL
jgi:hypothetical protein